MNNSLSYLLASLVVCGLIFAWWLGGASYLWGLGPLTAGFCIGIFLVAAGCFVLSFFKPSAATLGSIVCPGLGLLGTVIGITLALKHVGNIEHMLVDVGLAFHATVAGILFMVLLTVQEWLAHEGRG